MVFEDIQLQMGNVETYKKLAYVQAITMYWCEKQGIEYHVMSPSHWRKILKDEYDIVWGRKRAEQKQAALNFVENKYGKDPNITSDSADAICIGLTYQIEHKGAF